MQYYITHTHCMQLCIATMPSFPSSFIFLLPLPFMSQPIAPSSSLYSLFFPSPLCHHFISSPSSFHFLLPHHPSSLSHSPLPQLSSLSPHHASFVPTPPSSPLSLSHTHQEERTYVSLKAIPSFTILFTFGREISLYRL